ncbi:MAG: transcription elongation factor GreA [Actinomycetota bacterium]|jgi:transcription elongation factor GreA|nr:transcription elongation factor GreA [Actinomycetota bacterium]
MTEDATTWLTPTAHKKLVEELDQLTTVGRPAVAERLAEARSHGDIRENADYEAAKDEQGLLEARIRKIQLILDSAVVQDVVASDTIEPGSVVTLRREDGGEMDVFVAPQENKVPGYVLASPSSPLGAALLGASIGDTVSYEAPSGTFNVTVMAIKPFEG